MLRTLFSKMMVIYLAVTLGVLALMSFTVCSIFRNQYIFEKERELSREAGEIERIILPKYMYEATRPVAVDELESVARKFDALVEIWFDDVNTQSVVIMNPTSYEKWTEAARSDLETRALLLISSEEAVQPVKIYDSESGVAVMAFSAPLSVNGTVVGALFINVDMSIINQTLRQVYFDFFLSATISVLVIFLAGSYITARMTKPIEDMNHIVRRFTSGEFSARVATLSQDEIGELGVSFNRMADELNRLEQARRSFVANVSHEMRSPLTSMRGFLEAISDGTIPPEERQKYLDIVLEENKRMTNMVNDLLDLAKIESGQLELSYTSFDINELILRVLVTFETKIAEKNIEISLDFKQERCYASADKEQLVLVIRNLIDNAIKFMPQDGELKLSTGYDRREARVSIADSGAGIVDEDLPFIFDRFYKAEKAHTPSSTAGTGIGLSLVRRIIEQHGKHIVITRDEQLGGARFAFTLDRANEPARGYARKNEKKIENIAKTR